MSPAPERRRPGGTSLVAKMEPPLVGVPAAAAPGTAPVPAAAVDAPRRVQLNAGIREDLRRVLKARCAELGVEMRDAVEEALEAWITAHPAPDQRT